MSEMHTRKIPQETRVVIREATETDAAVLAKLYRSLVQDAHINVRPERLEAIAADPNNYLFVCEVDGVVCGTLLLTICLDAMYGNQPFGVIENVVVSETRRSTGIGSRLLEHVEVVCHERDCSKIMLLSAAARVQAHRFFERHGFSSAYAPSTQPMRTTSLRMLLIPR
jgi:N-acetylglutamate synthase-like GNAT family acetyltransferase